MTGNNTVAWLIVIGVLALVSNPCRAAIQNTGTQARAQSPSHTRESTPSRNPATYKDSQRNSRAISPQVRARAREFRQMSPMQQHRVLRAYRYYQSLPESRRHALRQQWQHEEKHTRSLEVDPRLKARRTGPGSQ